MSSTTYSKNFVQNLVFGGTSFSPPANYFLALSVGSISSTGSGLVDPSGAGYARVQIPNTKSYFTNAVNGTLVNSGSVVFPISSGSWGTIVDIALCDAATSGSVWYYTTLTTPKVVQDSTIISFAASAITITQS